MKKSPGRRRSKTEIRKILGEYRRSGLSQQRFCERRGVALSTLTYWLSRERKSNENRGTTVKPARAELVPVRIVDGPKLQNSSTIEVESAQGYMVRVPVGLDPDVLARYVHALEGRC